MCLPRARQVPGPEIYIAARAVASTWVRVVVGTKAPVAVCLKAPVVVCTKAREAVCTRAPVAACTKVPVVVCTEAPVGVCIEARVGVCLEALVGACIGGPVGVCTKGRSLIAATFRPGRFSSNIWKRMVTKKKRNYSKKNDPNEIPGTAFHLMSPASLKDV